jgi:hypothetical protein
MITIVGGKAMVKCRLSILLLIPLLIAPGIAAQEGAADPQTAIEWVGKHRDEVIKLLGDPVKIKKNSKGEILTFHGPLEWFAESSELPHLPGQIVVKPESENPIRIGIKPTGAAASPADDYELITDGDGNLVGAYGAAITPPGTGVVTVHRMKLFLDEKGYVYRTKIGKRVAK